MCGQGKGILSDSLSSSFVDMINCMLQFNMKFHVLRSQDFICILLVPNHAKLSINMIIFSQQILV